MTKEQLVEQWQMERRDQDYVKWLENKLLESTTHDAVLADVLAEFTKHGHTSSERFEMTWDTLEKILSKYFS